MSRFEVSTGELASAGHSLRGAAGSLVALGGGGGTGTGELDGALAGLASQVADVASLLDAAAIVSGRHLEDAAAAYEDTDGSQFSGWTTRA